MATLLVTGAAGFIGSNYVRHHLGTHPHDRIVALDLLTYAGHRKSLADVEDRITFLREDIAHAARMEAVLTEHAVDVVVNFAAESHNSFAVLQPWRFFRTNVVGTAALLEAARQAKVARFHHISTCEVYGDLPLEGDPVADGTVFGEHSPYRPRTPYNASKAGADHAVRAYGETYGLPVTITNSANNYGPYQFPEKVIPLFTTNALRDRPLPLYASTQHRREWIHVLDHCRAIDAVLDRGELGRTYLVGTGVERTVEEIADAVLAALGKPASLKQIVPDRPGHDRRYLLDSSLTRDELGWAPTIDFDEGLAATVGWYAEHRDWWEPLIGRSPVVELSVWEHAE